MRSLGLIFGFAPAMRITTTLFAALTTLGVCAQLGRKDLLTDSGLVVLHHFDNGTVSTKEWTDADQRWGRSFAYDPSGREVFNYATRRIGGHATARFSYHPNGGVSKVEVSNAPDGGIQWYKSTTTFDLEGRQTGFSEYGRDDHGVIPRIDPEPPKPVVPMHEQEVVECQRMFLTELFVVNPTKASVRVVATPKAPSPAMPGGTYTMAPGDTIRIGTFSMGEIWPEWKSIVQLNIVQVVLGDRNKAVARIRNEEKQLNEAHRQVHVVIEGWATNRTTPGQEKQPGPPGPPTQEQKKKPWWRFW